MGDHPIILNDDERARRGPRPAAVLSAKRQLLLSSVRGREMRLRPDLSDQIADLPGLSWRELAHVPVFNGHGGNQRTILIATTLGLPYQRVRCAANRGSRRAMNSPLDLEHLAAALDLPSMPESKNRRHPDEPQNANSINLRRGPP